MRRSIYRRALGARLNVQGGCNTSATGVFGFAFPGHVNLDDLHITTAYKIDHAISTLSNEHSHSK